MARQLYQQAGQQNILDYLTNPAINVNRGASNVARTLGLGAVPDILGTGVAAGQELLSGQNPFNYKGTPAQLQSTYQYNPFMSAADVQNTERPVGGMRTAAQDLAGAAGWLAGGLTGATTPWLARAGIGAAAGGLMGASNSRIKTSQDLMNNVLAGAGTGAIANVAIPPILRGLGSGLARLAYGKAGEEVPQIAEETGQYITGPESQGAQNAQQMIGQKIGDIYQQASERGLSLSPQDVQDLMSQQSELLPTGATSSKLDQILNKLNIFDPNKLQAARSYATGAGTATSFTSDLDQSLSDYVASHPSSVFGQDLMDYVNSQGGIENINNIPLPASFWQQFSSDLSDKVPYDKITDPVSGRIDYSKLGGVQSMQSYLSSSIKNMLKNQIGTVDPEQLIELERLNGMYGASSKIASGTAKGLISPQFMARYGIALPAILGVGALGAQGASQTRGLSPYIGAMGALAVLANPSLAGPIASQVGMLPTRMAIPALAGLLGSRQAQSLVGQ